MFARPVYSLLIPGNEKRHYDQVDVLFNYLTDYVDVAHKNIVSVKQADTDNTLFQISNFFKNLPFYRSVDVIVAYAGHGLKDSFHPNGHAISYQAFSDLFRQRDRFVFLNGSCHSQGCINEFEKKGLLNENGRIIASAELDELSYGKIFWNSVLQDFKAGRDYKRKKVGNWIYLSDKMIAATEKISNMTASKALPSEDTSEKIPSQKTVVQQRLYFNVSHPVVAGAALEHILFPKDLKNSE